MKNHQIRFKRPPLPEKHENKFVYNKQKFSSPQFFMRSISPVVNRNLLQGIYSPQPKRNDLKLQAKSGQQNTLLKQNKELKVNKKKQDLEETQKGNIKRQITKNDSIYNKKLKEQKSNHHNFLKLQASPNQQNLLEKRNYQKHKRVQSEPSNIEEVKNLKSQRQQKNKNVKFNQPKISTNLITLKKQARQKIQKSRSNSILKNKYKRNRVYSVETGATKIRSSSVNSESSKASIEINQQLYIKQNNVNATILKKYNGALLNLRSKLKQARSNSNFPKNGIQSSQQQKQLLKQTQKYTDALFPPTYSSLFGSLSLGNHQRKGQQIKWVRVKQLFPNNQIVVYQKDNDIKSNISINKGKYGSQKLSVALNSIKNCKSLLKKIFQEQKYNQFGIYILKIFQQNIWKYVIVDDKIPVIDTQIIRSNNPKSKKGKNQLNLNIQTNYIPAFSSIGLVKKKGNNVIQIWPLLLEKAYSNYYSSYQTFHLGNQVDYLQEISGSSSIVLDFSNILELKETFAFLQHQLSASQSFALGQVEEQIPFVPIISNRFNSSNYSSLYATNKSQRQQYKQNQSSLIYYDPLNHFIQCVSVYEKLPTLFNKIYIFNFEKYKQLSSSIVGHYQSLNNPKGNKIQRAQISLRHFQLKEKSYACLSIRQKQKRFYEHSSFKYQYMWVRAILIQKQFNGQYRWIAGKYSNIKSITFETFLNEGHYFLVIMPEWRQVHCHQFNLFLWHNSYSKVPLEKIKYDCNDQIIQKACMDLSQRKGKLSQINAFICSYNLLNQEVGLIIQNINNQRTVGTVKVMRSINGLKANVVIVPINKQFYQISEQQAAKTKKKYKNNIVISIPQQQSYTVVLRMKGGIDSNFFRVFDFGN